jgi:hypothetical protein
VCDQETSKNEEAKARYRAVKIQPQWVVTAGKQTNSKESLFLLSIPFRWGVTELWTLEKADDCISILKVRLQFPSLALSYLKRSETLTMPLRKTLRILRVL